MFMFVYLYVYLYTSITVVQTVKDASKAFLSVHKK